MGSRRRRLVGVSSGPPGAHTDVRVAGFDLGEHPARLEQEALHGVQCRLGQAIADTTGALAARLAAGTGGPAADVSADVAAHALVGVHRALIDRVRRRLLSDDDPARLSADVREYGAKAFALLAHGCADYGVRPSGGREQA